MFSATYWPFYFWDSPTGLQAREQLDAGSRRHRWAITYPVRAVTRPIKLSNSLWRPYMARHRQNFVWQYHNGGIWPMVGGLWVTALMAAGRVEQAEVGTDQIGARMRASKLAIYRMASWENARTARNAGTVLERRGIPHGGARGLGRQDYICRLGQAVTQLTVRIVG